MTMVSLMGEAGISVTIRCNVDETNWDGIPQFLGDLKACVTHKEHVGVYFCPLNDVRMGKGDVVMWKKIRDARPMIENAGFRATPFIGLGLGFRTFHCMADGGSVVITPDGCLYPCEHCPEGSRFGDIWHGVTDDAARQAFCSVGTTREKCRTCPFLPDCTGFANCPIQDTHCREVREIMAIDALKRMVEDKEGDNANRENPIC